MEGCTVVEVLAGVRLVEEATEGRTEGRMVERPPPFLEQEEATAAVMEEELTAAAVAAA